MYKPLAKLLKEDSFGVTFTLDDGTVYEGQAIVTDASSVTEGACEWNMGLAGNGPLAEAEPKGGTMIKKWFYCQNCDDNPNADANAMQARASVNRDGTVMYLCFGCGGTTQLVDKVCEHEWLIVLSEAMRLFPYMDHGPAIRKCTKCPARQTAETTILWTDA